ncbi:CPBP family intramembrane metalloprotease [Amycolatopsis balhimycina DSM 5908]|uniref:CPBP family intramembrane metalloprotease n=1 Tax=Amycolatopsis balhimycina DSM 5908 TaxID=1081091 RepID=A0A428WRT7_AMYBA|nr:type II CAAX endopeptidase family protein [Amycolatopsis balhimycina]RSM45786.1 CPBP family intramembrane metalloprotease [Amycolatopsis balhimycina DSM 5908]
MSLASPVRQKSGLALFWAVTFTTSWAFWLVAILLGGPPTSSPTVIPYLLGGFGPVIGAIVLRVHRARRREPAPAHAVSSRPSARWFWTVPLLVLASATVVAAALLAEVLGGPALNLTTGRNLIATVGGPVPFLVSMLIGGPLAEEPGWRGTAYPRLRSSMTRLRAGLLLGVVWAGWHLPLFFIPGTLQAGFGLLSWSGLLFILNVIPMALLTGYAYDRGGVPASIAVHFGVNTTIALLTINSPVTQALVLVVQAVVGFGLLGRRSLVRPPVTD